MEVCEVFWEDCLWGLRDVGWILEMGMMWEVVLVICLFVIVILLVIGESWRRVFGEVGGGDVGGCGWSWSVELGFIDLLLLIGFWLISVCFFVV